MLNDIYQAEEAAQKIVDTARQQAEATLKEARDGAVQLIEKTEEDIRMRKEQASEEGKAEGQKEARSLIAKAQKDIEKQEAALKGNISKVADTVTQKIVDAL